ncbi:hypothetical protein Pedsa_0972 [Pseudopedobacter saltans DSM 12145]|uniref:Uncharacterized protein n=1 Tax=Pseudopedobacter saltans (strain ATCC 51119 / DSM 12145 / JCM 21818 / CCUG 39354 / LMG 10337 / NBRC 100064 / NCIMB 13643) TaxID=762903 RepID=F0SAU9_PSESL|nr:hypothetical protein [Pseudopedobacter saltans]ADY51544.1 hypothetical protein Pedsa_0972 [Pseudopedobacter saltans DSM 12145]
MKITLKLTEQEMLVLSGFLDLTFDENLKKGNIYNKIIFANLSELIIKVKLAGVMVKKKYSINISHASALSFIAHCKNSPNVELEGSEAVSINNIIQQINKKTC